MEENIEKEYAKDLLELSKNSVEPNKSTTGEYLSTPLKRFPHWRAQDLVQADKIYRNLDKKKLLISSLVFATIFYIIGYFILRSMK